MSTAEWWTSLLQGSLGAVIGLVGLFGVFWLTRRHEMSRDTVTRRENEKAIARQRTEAGIVQIIEAAHELRLGSAPATDDQLESLCHALTLLSVKEAADHPAAAGWARSQSSEVLKLRGPKTDIRAAPWQGGYITAVLTQWAHRRFPENFFEEANDEGGDEHRHRDDDVDSAVAQLDRAGKPATVENLREIFVAQQGGNMPQATENPAKESCDRKSG